jgi:hypothetical protein
MAYVVARGNRAMRWSAISVVGFITAYLWVYHTALLFRYLTWPLAM